MSLLIPSFLKPTLPTAPVSPSAPRSGGANAAARALKDIRQDAKDMRKALAAPPAAPAAVATVGAYDPQAWSLLTDFNKILQAIGNLLAGLNGAPANPQPTNPGPSTPPKPPTGVTRFNVSSFNILGSNHTMRGNKYLRGPERARLAAELLAQKDVHVVGFQEMANDQVTAFMGASGGKFGIYPGNSLGKWGSQNSIAWRKDTWDFVKAQHHEIPFLNGMKRQIPVVLLRNKETGQQAYFTNFHNAAHRKGGPDQQKFRDAATDIEIALVNRLKRESGLPVIVTGDMNEKQNYFKRMTREADMTSANFGDIKGVPKQTGIDWIFGSEGVKFKGFHRERGALQQKISDHATLVSQVQIG